MHVNGGTPGMATALHRSGSVRPSEQLWLLLLLLVCAEWSISEQNL